MADSVVLINGLPGAGKTSLAARLGAALPAPVLSKDTIKEALASVLDPVFGGPRLGQAAMDVVWFLAAVAPGTVIIESFWHRPRDLEFARSGLRSIAARSAVEIWCHAPEPIVRDRYANRVRDAIHADNQRLQDDWAEWSNSAAPLNICPVLQIDTTSEVDLSSLTASLSDALG